MLSTRRERDTEAARESRDYNVIEFFAIEYLRKYIGIV